MEGFNGHRERWIDGLRGIAVCIVVLYHTISKDKPLLSDAWLEALGPGPKRQLFLQFLESTPVRLLTAGHAMVRLSFVLSGYAVALSYGRNTQQRLRSGPLQDLAYYQRLSSAILRRWLQLYLPLAITTFLAHTLAYMDAWGWDILEETSCTGARPWSSPWPHFKCFVRMLSANMACMPIQPFESLFQAAWTMPHAVQGSCFVLLILVALAPVHRGNARVGICAALMLFYLYFGSLVAAMLGGLLLAEMRAAGMWPVIDYEPSELHKRERLNLSYMKETLAWTTCCVGIYIMSLPEHAEDGTRGHWSFLQRYAGTDEAAHWEVIWYSTGAIMLVAGLHAVPEARSFLESRTAQFFGRISFPLYLTHQVVAYATKLRTLNVVCYVLSGENFYDYEHHYKLGDDGYNAIFLATSWTLTMLIVLSVTVLFAAVFTKAVMPKCNKLAYAAEGWLIRR